MGIREVGLHTDWFEVRTDRVISSDKEYHTTCRWLIKNTEENFDFLFDSVSCGVVGVFFRSKKDATMFKIAFPPELEYRQDDRKILIKRVLSIKNKSLERFL